MLSAIFWDGLLIIWVVFVLYSAYKFPSNIAHWFLPQTPRDREDDNIKQKGKPRPHYKYCTHCGKEIRLDDRFCPYCGTDQNKMQYSYKCHY